MVFYHSSAANAIPILIYKGALTAFFWRNRGLWPRQAVRGHKKEGGVMKMKKFSYALHNTGQLLSAKAPECYSNVKKAGLKRLDAVSVPKGSPARPRSGRAMRTCCAVCARPSPPVCGLVGSNTLAAQEEFFSGVHAAGKKPGIRHEFRTKLKSMLICFAPEGAKFCEAKARGARLGALWRAFCWWGGEAL